MRITHALIALTLISGCATTTGKVAGGVAVGATVLAGLTMTSSCRDDCADANLATGIALGGTAVVAAIIAGVAEARHSEAPAATTSSRAVPPCPPAAVTGLRCF